MSTTIYSTETVLGEMARFQGTDMGTGWLPS